MKFRCRNCGAIYYTDSQPPACDECGGELEDVSRVTEEVFCPVRGGKTKTIRGIPVCDDFNMSNAVGFRCTNGELPCECAGSSLPFYNPRVGTST